MSCGLKTSAGKFEVAGRPSDARQDPASSGAGFFSTTGSDP